MQLLGDFEAKQNLYFLPLCSKNVSPPLIGITLILPCPRTHQVKLLDWSSYYPFNAER